MHGIILSTYQSHNQILLVPLADGLGEADLKECLAMINMKNCSVKALRHAQQTNSIPADLVLNAALDLCEKLQEKYDASAQIIQVGQDLCVYCLSKLLLDLSNTHELL